MSPPGIIREEIGVFDSGARFGHHKGDGIAPLEIMGGFLVFGGGIRVPVDFDQNEARRVIGLTDEVEASDAGFLDAAASIFEGGFDECLDVFGFDVDVDMDDLHREVSFQPQGEDSTQRCKGRKEIISITGHFNPLLFDSAITYQADSPDQVFDFVPAQSHTFA